MYILASASKLAEFVLENFSTLLLLGSFLFLFWGLVWDRILIKAGFFGKTYWRIYGLLMTPCLGIVALAFSYDLDTDTFVWPGELLFDITSILAWVGMAVIAYIPWPVVKQLKQIRQAKQIPEPVTAPTGIFGLPANWYNAMRRKIKGKK